MLKNALANQLGFSCGVFSEQTDKVEHTSTIFRYKIIDGIKESDQINAFPRQFLEEG